MAEKVRKICAFIFELQGLICLLIAFLLWRTLSIGGLPQNELDALPLLLGLSITIGVILLFYGILQFRREYENAMNRFFDKKVVNIISSVLAYLVSLSTIGFFTLGNVHLKWSIGIPILVIGIAAVAGDVLVKLNKIPE